MIISKKNEGILVFIIETQSTGEFEFRQISVCFFKTGFRQIILTIVPEKRNTAKNVFFFLSDCFKSNEESSYNGFQYATSIKINYS